MCAGGTNSSESPEMNMIGCFRSWIFLSLYQPIRNTSGFKKLICGINLSTIAAIIVVGVDILYIRKVFFATNEYNALDSSEDALPFWTAIFREFENIFNWGDHSDSNATTTYNEEQNSVFTGEKSKMFLQHHEFEPSEYISKYNIGEKSPQSINSSDKIIGDNSGNKEHTVITL